MQKRNIVIINVYTPSDCPAEKFVSPLNELRTKRIEIENSMPNIILAGDLNFSIIDWQMETADGETHENQVQANVFLQFAQEQCLQQYIEQPKRKNNILDVFLTNNDQLKEDGGPFGIWVTLETGQCHPNSKRSTALFCCQLPTNFHNISIV